ncbi:hypothetical protein FGO68_gene10145 [Halteria grandinella]|uniref:J domain-containing protein n=1 Tax=Halteria grandinella TaxID=5974 RepID=A0A8J8SW28_HALGN|nr:hypothetical protein FGO68_gene10145 [Halteria grandinella]
MGKNYYEILSVPPMAPPSQIASSFRVLALTYHPSKQVSPSEVASSNYRFAEVCEAYEVLSNHELREIYDRYGEELLKSGIPPEKAEGSKKNPVVTRGGYRFSGNTNQIFEQFFGTNNPFTSTLDGKGNLITPIEQLKAAVADSADADMKMTIECTLEEFFYGCLKEVSFERYIVSKTAPSGYITQRQKRTVEVRPGMGAKELRYPGEGHVRFGKAQGDLIVSLVQKQHNKFKRQGDDLIYSHKISLVDSLKSLPIHFTTIDNEPIEIAVDEIISPQTEKVLAGKGMPVLNDDPLGPIKRNFQRGKLIIKFDIEFPSVLSEEQRHALSAVLDEALEAETA